jgi:hypothetical protein
MSTDHDKDALLDALYARQVSTGKHPSVWEAQRDYLPEWDRDRMFDAAQALEAAGDILNVTGALLHVDLSSTARQRAAARADQSKGHSTTYNIGSMHHSPMQHVASGGHGVQNTQYQMNANDLRAVIDLYRHHVEELKLDPPQRRKATGRSPRSKPS